MLCNLIYAKLKQDQETDVETKHDTFLKVVSDCPEQVCDFKELVQVFLITEREQGLENPSLLSLGRVPSVVHFSGVAIFQINIVKRSLTS